MKKKFYVCMPVVILYLFVVVIGILFFIWECSDVGEFVWFSFITSVLMPIAILIFITIIAGAYLTFDEKGATKYLFGIKLKHFDWTEVKEIKTIGLYIVISKIELDENKRFYRSKYILNLMYSEKAAKEIKNLVPKDIKCSLNF